MLADKNEWRNPYASSSSWERRLTRTCDLKWESICLPKESPTMEQKKYCVMTGGKSINTVLFAMLHDYATGSHVAIIPTN